MGDIDHDSSLKEWRRIWNSRFWIWWSIFSETRDSRMLLLLVNCTGLGQGWKCFSFNFSKSKTSQAGWIVNLSYYYALWKGKHGIPCNPQMIYSPHTLFGCIWRRLANWLVVNRIMQWLKPQGSFFFLIWWRHSQQPYVNSLCYFMNKNIKNQCQWKMREFPPTWCKTSYCHLLRKCMLRYENWAWKNC